MEVDIEEVDEPVQLIEFQDAPADNPGSKSVIKLHYKTLDTILAKVGNRPLVIYSVCGRARQGKSMLLGYMIRKLEAMEQNQTSWMGWNAPRKPLGGFKFRNGVQPETHGVWMWSRPFIVKNSEDEEVAVLLVDTQGTEDAFTKEADMSLIVGLTLLISSVTVLNIFSNLHEDILKSLNTYIEFASYAKDTGGATGDQERPFQKLVFLIRDWNMPVEYAYGEGDKFLQTNLEITEDKPKENHLVRERIRDCFQELRCFLMPHIGQRAITSEKFNGSLAMLDKEFATKLEWFIRDLINPKSLISKNILGQEVTSEQFRKLISSYVKVFNEGNNAFVNQPMLEAMTQITNDDIVEQSLREYKARVAQDMDASTAGYLPEKVLKETHASAEKHALNHFTSSRKFGDPGQLSRFQTSLITDIATIFKQTRVKCSDKRDKLLEELKIWAREQLEERLEQRFPVLVGDTFYDGEDIRTEVLHRVPSIEQKAKARLHPKEDAAVTTQLVKELNDTWVEITQGYLKDNKVNQEKAEKKVKFWKEDHISSYRDKMEVMIIPAKEQKTLTSELFEEMHDKAKYEVIKNFKNQMHNFPNKFQAKHTGQLDAALQTEFQNLEEQHELFWGDEELEAEEFEEFLANIVQECHKMYQTKMQATFQQVGSLDELETLHNTASSMAEETFDKQWSPWQVPKEAPSRQDCLSELRQKMDKAYSQLKNAFAWSRKKDVTAASPDKAVQDAFKFYKNEMQTYFRNQKERVHPRFLEMEHNLLRQIAMGKARQAGGGGEALSNLETDMDNMYEEFKSENDVKFNELKDVAIGIDLGTTYCAVGVYLNGKVEMIPNLGQGGMTTPSYVAYPSGRETYGRVAKESASNYPEDTIYDAKRMIGRPWDDPVLQEDIKTWMFEVVNDRGMPKIKIGDKTRFPQEISAKLLVQFCRMAEVHLKKPPGSIRKAVITVPAYFTEGQRRATIEAGESAGIEVLGILNEPTAAAIAYKFQRLESEAKKALIYDLGGGTFDVAIVEVGPKHVKSLGVDGDTHLGGQDFDKLLVNHCAEQFRREANINLLDGSPAYREPLMRLQLQCEKAKQTLSTSDATDVMVLNIVKNVHLMMVIKKETLEDLVKPLLTKTLDIVERALRDTKGIRDKDDIDDIILIGGSTKMSLVTKMLENFFGGKQLNNSINPDEAVAFGAAVQAAVLNGRKCGDTDFKTTDVTPMSLGVGTYGDGMSIVLDKNQPIPCQTQRTYITSEDDVENILFMIYQGEEKVASKNKKLGEFRLTGLKKGKVGEEKADVIMQVNEQGILKVTAVSQTTGSTNQIEVDETKMRMDRKAIEEAKKEVMI